MEIVEVKLEKLRTDIIGSSKSDIEIIKSARLLTPDYDHQSIKLIKRGG